MRKPKIFKPGSLDWLEERTKNVTATELASLFSMNKHKSPRALIKDKFEPQTVWTSWIRRGRILEPAVLEAMREDLTWNVEPISADGVAFYKYPKVRLSATPDAKILDEDGDLFALLECKSASEARIEDWDFGVPAHYTLQVHAQMMCTGVKKAYIACLGAFDPFPLIVYKVEWHEELSKLILDTVNKFWQDVNKTKSFKPDKDDKKLVREWLPKTVTRVY